MVPVIKVKGFRCFVDEAVFSNQKGDFAQLVSLVGSREAVKALWARLMKGEAAYFENGEQFRAVKMNTAEGAKLLTERLPSGAFHGLLLSRALLQGEMVLCEYEADLPTRFYHYLTRKLRLPLHDTWSDWLWERALGTEMVEKLSSQWLHAYEVSLSVPDFEMVVRQALVAGELPEIEVQRAA